MIDPKYIDATLLNPRATAGEVDAFCRDAIACGVACVMVNPCFVPLCKSLTQGTDVVVGTVIDFPLGAGTVADKVAQTVEAVKNGAHDIDLVAGLHYANAGDYEGLEQTVRAVRSHVPNILKVILETSELTDEQIVASVQACARAGADFVKTSTGFVGSGATEHAVRLMKQTVDVFNTATGANVRVKASGGIRTVEQARAMIAAGAERIGASAYRAMTTEV